MLDEILPDATDNRSRQLFLIGVVIQASLLLRVRDKGRLDQRRGNIRCLEHSKAGLLDTGLVQGIDRADFAEQVFAQFQAIVDGGRLRKIE